MGSEVCNLNEELRAEALRLAQLAAVGTAAAKIEIGQALVALKPGAM